jgi:hypothetical protein
MTGKSLSLGETYGIGKGKLCTPEHAEALNALMRLNKFFDANPRKENPRESGVVERMGCPTRDLIMELTIRVHEASGVRR